MIISDVDSVLLWSQASLRATWGIGASPLYIKTEDIGENRFWLGIWGVIAIVVIVIVIVISITTYNIVDRIGSVRPIVTRTESYQAK
jgi:hypothetical protein